MTSECPVTQVRLRQRVPIEFNPRMHVRLRPNAVHAQLQRGGKAASPQQHVNGKGLAKAGGPNQSAATGDGRQLRQGLSLLDVDGAGRSWRGSSAEVFGNSARASVAKQSQTGGYDGKQQHQA